MASDAGIYLNHRTTGCPNALGVEGRLLVAFDHGKSDLLTYLADRPLENRRLAGAG